MAWGQNGQTTSYQTNNFSNSGIFVLTCYCPLHYQKQFHVMVILPPTIKTESWICFDRDWSSKEKENKSQIQRNKDRNWNLALIASKGDVAVREIPPEIAPAKESAEARFSWPRILHTPEAGKIQRRSKEVGFWARGGGGL